MTTRTTGHGRLVLLSNGYAPGSVHYLRHALDVLAEAFDGVQRVVFIPHAQHDLDRHTAAVAHGLQPLGIQVLGAHRSASPRSTVETAEAVMVGGGNAFRLLHAMYRLDLVDVIRHRVAGGMAYVGTSAGTNLACPTIRTTNDMPITEPPSLTALGLVPFQINPHYPPGDPAPGQPGESRDRRLHEFLEDNDVPVLGLQEGSWLDVSGAAASIGGVTGGRLFQRGRSPRELLPGSDVSDLLRAHGRFDSPIG